MSRFVCIELVMWFDFFGEFSLFMEEDSMELE